MVERVAAGIARGRALRKLAGPQIELTDQLELIDMLRTSLHVPAHSFVHKDGESEFDELISHRELEVIIAFRVSPSVVAVAEKLCISPHTVRNHLESIVRKLEVNSQTELLAKTAPFEL